MLTSQRFFWAQILCPKIWIQKSRFQIWIFRSEPDQISDPGLQGHLSWPAVSADNFYLGELLEFSL